MQFKKDQEKDNALMQQQMNFAQKSAEDAVVTSPGFMIESTSGCID